MGFWMTRERARSSAARQSVASCPGGCDGPFWREFKDLYSAVAEMALLLLLFLLPLVEYFTICQRRGEDHQAWGGERWGSHQGCVGDAHIFLSQVSFFFNPNQTNQRR